MPYALARGNVAGAVVVVVKDGQLLLQKGYGYADMAAHKPVDPNNTLFRAGIGVQVVYLDRGDAAGREGQDRPGPRRQHLSRLRHSAVCGPAGDDAEPDDPHPPASKSRARTSSTPSRRRSHALTNTSSKTCPRASSHPARRPPTRIMAPTLAGYIVQRVSGQGFADYIDQQIFAPLGMRHATFRPTPARRAEAADEPRLSECHR